MPVLRVVLAVNGIGLDKPPVIQLGKLLERVWAFDFAVTGDLEQVFTRAMLECLWR
jgi:hypothetical protein